MNAIAGIIGTAASTAYGPAVQRMQSRIAATTACARGTVTFDLPRLQVAWIAPTYPATGDMPVWNDSRQIAVVLSGDVLVPTTTAAARLAAAWEDSGPAALLALHGWFNGLVIDLRHATVTIFNDRFGLGRLYYHAATTGFHFASEAKALLAVRPHLRQLDARGVAETFAVGCVLQNRSLFRDISLLPPASAWTFQRDGRVQKQCYFDPTTWENMGPLAPREYAERLREVFAQSVQRALGASRSALSLTGGLDSRAVIAWAPRDGMPCYTFGGPLRDCADVRIARGIAQICHSPHTTIRIDRDFFDDFGRLAEQTVNASDGTMDVSGAAELHVNRRARLIAPVRLTGNYGSEILRSNVAFRPRPLDHSLFTPEFNALIAEAAVTYRTEAACHPLTFIAFKQVPWHHHARFTIERSQLAPRSPYLDPALVELAYRAPAELRTSAQPLLQLIAEGNPALAGFATDRALRVSPFPVVSRVTQSWQDFTARAEYAFDYGMPRWLARADRVLTRLHLERLFLGRHKFCHFRMWYRHELSDAVREHAGAGDTAPFCFRPGAARRIVGEHLTGRANRTLELHRLLTLQFIERTLLQ